MCGHRYSREKYLIDKMASNSTRRASHAGSWYIASGRHLTAELEKWLGDAPVSESHSPARAIIAPHAGYRYSGPCAAHAYKQVDPFRVKRVFILGPSHHVYLSGCALSAVQVYETPLYNLDIDQDVYHELHASGQFETMTRNVDEEEHSIEMHLPYVAKVMESRKGQYKIVPVLVGALKEEKEAAYGQLFSKYLARPENLFVVSSDFCHWGKRFRYTWHNKSKASISASIHDLDHQGMGLIEALDPMGFSAYLDETQNTICGRRPISILLNAVSHLQSTSAGRFSLKFVKYAQSNQCQSLNDSSVSYASASLVAATEPGQC